MVTRYGAARSRNPVASPSLSRRAPKGRNPPHRGCSAPCPHRAGTRASVESASRPPRAEARRRLEAAPPSPRAGTRRAVDAALDSTSGLGPSVSSSAEPDSPTSRGSSLRRTGFELDLGLTRAAPDRNPVRPWLDPTPPDRNPESPNLRPKPTVDLGRRPVRSCRWLPDFGRPPTLASGQQADLRLGTEKQRAAPLRCFRPAS